MRVKGLFCDSKSLATQVSQPRPSSSSVESTTSKYGISPKSVGARDYGLGMLAEVRENCRRPLRIANTKLTPQVPSPSNLLFKAADEPVEAQSPMITPPSLNRSASRLSWAMKGNQWDGEVQRFNPLYDHAFALVEDDDPDNSANLEVFRFDPATRTFFELDNPKEAPSNEVVYVRVSLLGTHEEQCMMAWK